MKPRRLSALRLSFPLAAALAALFTNSALAATYYWDQNAATTGFGAGTGTWTNPTVSRWSTNSSGTATPGASITTAIGDPLNFGTDTVGLGTGSITVTGTVDAASLRFGSQTTGNVNLSGGTINLGATTTIHVGAGSTTVHTISSTITGASTSLTKTGNHLQLSGANSYTGSTNIPTGVLSLANANPLGTIPGTNGTSGISISATATLSSSTGGTNPSTTIAAPITLSGTGNTNLRIGQGAGSNTHTFNINGAIGGTTGNLVYTTTTNSFNNGSSVFLIGAAGTYTGNTLITTGNGANNPVFLRAGTGVANALPVTTTLTFAGVAGGGTGRTFQYDLNGNNQTLAGLTNTVASLRRQLVTSTNPATLTINNTTDMSFGGSDLTSGSTTRAQIQGAIALTKSGTGTFTLGGTLLGGATAGGNTFTGPTKILGGILNLGETGSLQNSPLDTTASILGSSTDGLRSSVTSLTLGGITGDKNFLDVFTTTTGGYTDLSNLTLNPGTGVTHSYSADVGNGNGNMSLTKSGAGTHILNTTQTFTGGAIVNAGTLALAHATNTLPDSGAVTINGGTLDLGANNDTVASVTLNNGSITGGGTLTGSSYDMRGGNVSAILDGSAALTKSTAGTLTLSAANTYTGGTNVNGGIVLISGANNLPSSGTLAINTGGNFSLADGTARTTTANGGLTIASGSTLTFDWNDIATDSLTTTAAVTTTASDVIWININGTNFPAGGPHDLISAAAGSSLDNANYFLANNTDYTATISKTAQKVSIGSYASVPPLFDAYWIGGQLSGAGLGAMTLSSGTSSNWADNETGTLAGGVVPGGTSVNVIFGATGATQQSQVTTEGGPDINLASITFNDTTAVTIGGTRTITLNSTSSTAASTTAALAAVIPGSAISVTSFANNTNTINANIALGTAQTWNVASGKDLQVGGIVSGTGALTKAETGTVTLSGANTYTGATTISAGTLTLTGNRTAQMFTTTVGNVPGSTGTLNIQNGNFTIGTGGSTFVVGSGVDPTIFGVVNQSGGNITTIGNQLLLGVGTGTTVGSSATGTYNLSGGTLNTITGTLGVTIGTNQGATGFFHLSGTGVLNMPATSTMQIGRSDASTVANSTGTFTQTGGTATIGILSMGGAAAATSPGTTATMSLTGGTLTLTTFNALSAGDTSTSTINIGGTADVTLPNFPITRGSGSTAVLNIDGGLIRNSATGTFISGLTSATINNGGATFDTSLNSTTISQALLAGTGSGGITKLGTNTLTLSGANTYVGVTAINQGRLQFANQESLYNNTPASWTAANIKVLSGATLGLSVDTTGVAGFSATSLDTLLANISVANTATEGLQSGANLGLDTAASTSFTQGNSIGDSTGAFGGAINLVKSGAGTLVLDKANTYTGSTSVNLGALSVAHNDALGSTTGTTTVNGGNGTGAVSLSLSNATSDLTITEDLNFFGSAAGRTQLVNNSALNHTLSGDIDVSSATNLTQFTSSGAGSITISGDITGTLTNNAVLFVRGESTSALNRLTGSVNLTGGNFAKTDGGTWLLGSAGKTYSWINTMIANGRLKMGLANILPSASELIMGNPGGGSNGILDLNGFNQTVAGIVYNGAGTATGTKTITNSDLSNAAVITIDNATDYSSGSASGANNIVLTGNMGLTKNGTGKLTLLGANTYTGNTVVSAGTLALADNSQLRFVTAASGVNNTITGSGETTLDGDFFIDTTASDGLASGTWTFENLSNLTGGAYGSTFSVVGFSDIGGDKWEKVLSPFKKYTFDETTGVLTLTSSASYATWIDTFYPGETNPLIVGASADPDFDGISNAVELVIGGNPATGMDSALLPTIELVNADPDGDTTFADYLLFTYRRADLAVASGLTIDCETDIDLISPWTPATGAPGVVILTDDNYASFTPTATNTDRVRVYIPRGANTKLFGRLNVTVP